MKFKAWVLFCFFVLLVGCKVTGQVTYEGIGLEGVAVTLSGDTTQTVVTDSEGRYAFEGLGNGSYSVSAESVGFTFSLESSSVTVKNGDVESVDFTAEKRAVEIGKISDMCSGGTPGIVYALDQDNGALLSINTTVQHIVRKVDLNDPSPVALSFSKVENKVFVLSKMAGAISMYDLNTLSLSEIEGVQAGENRDIEISESLNRIYALSAADYQASITVFNLATGERISNSILSHNRTSAITFDKNSQKLFASNSGVSPSSIFRYSTTDDQIILEQSLRSGGNGRSVSISPDGSQLVFPCGGGNGPGYTVYDYDTSDFNNVRGEWDVGTYPTTAAFSPDGLVLYGTNGDPYDMYLYIMEAHNYSEVRKLPFPNADDYAVITPNSDGSMVVGFSYNDYYDEDYELYYFSNVKLDATPPPHELGIVSDMVAGSVPEIVYALDQTNQCLYEINTNEERIEHETRLTCTQPLSMSFSSLDSKCYIVSKFSGSVSVLDMESSEISEIPFSYSDDGLDIAVSFLQRKIYVLAVNSNGTLIYILDMDTGEVRSRTELTDRRIRSIQYDEHSEKLFASNSGVSPSSIFRYATADDVITLEQSLRSGGNGRTINLSPDGTKLVFPCGAGNGPGYTIYDYDTSDFNNVRGEWSVDAYPFSAEFSPDGAVLYGTNGSMYDNYLYILDAHTYSEIRKLPFPNSGDYSVITPNLDGTKVVGFSYDDYSNEGHKLYFFSNVKPDPNPAPFALGVISDMEAGTEPDKVYALDKTHQQLYVINPLREWIDTVVELPYTQPLEMAYSGLDSKAYIVSRFSGSVCVVDMGTYEIVDIPFSTSDDGVDIAVSALQRKIYVLAKNNDDSLVYILNMDSGDVLSRTELSDRRISAIQFDENTQKLLASNSGVSPSSIFRFSTANNEIVMEQSLRSGGNGKRLSLSPDGTKLVFPCGGGNGSGYTIYDYDAWDFNHVRGEWNVGAYPESAAFSPDGSILYATSGDWLHVMDANNYTLTRKLDLPNADDYSLIMPNSDGSMVVGFSYDTYSGDNKQLYFYQNVQQ